MRNGERGWWDVGPEFVPDEPYAPLSEPEQPTHGSRTSTPASGSLSEIKAQLAVNAALLRADAARASR